MHPPRFLLRPVGGLLSTAAGLVGALFGGAAGPLYAIYFSNLRLEREAFRATASTTLLILALLRLGGYTGLGLYDRATLIALAAALPLMWLGGRLAEHVSKRIAPHVFSRIVGGVLLVSGTALLLK